MAHLQNRRAPGNSVPVAEYFRHAVAPADPDFLAAMRENPLLPAAAGICTAAFALSTIPDSWSMALVIPLLSGMTRRAPLSTGLWPWVCRLCVCIPACYTTASRRALRRLRADAQAGFRAHRSINHNPSALHHAVDRS